MTATIRALLQFNCRIKSIGRTAQMDNHENCRLGIFNRINFMGLLTGIIIPVAVPVILVPVKDESVEVHVQDTGKGISSDHIQQLFSNNYFTTKGTANESGTGMGLMLCKEFLCKNGGEIFVESEEGKGSTLSFTIPKA